VKWLVLLVVVSGGWVTTNRYEYRSYVRQCEYTWSNRAIPGYADPNQSETQFMSGCIQREIAAEKARRANPDADDESDGFGWGTPELASTARVGIVFVGGALAFIFLACDLNRIWRRRHPIVSDGRDGSYWIWSDAP
jgi:hypothetical protein